MRIGMMLRSLDEKGGIGVYTNNLLHELLRIDDKNEYILFYRKVGNIGRFAHFNNVAERVVSASNKAFWDQIAIPLACWREKVDVVFNPKFTAPLLAPCKAVMVVHGADWFIPEQAQFYGRVDVQYIHLMMPLYFKKCSTVISVSQLTTDNFNRILRLPSGKVKTVYFGPARNFRPITDEAVLQKAKKQYALPDKFILTLTKRKGDERKNLGNIFKAYESYHKHAANPHRLVIGGKDGHLFRDEYNLPQDGYGHDIHFPGWIDQEDLPAVYSLAGLYLYPSNVEAFPIPLTEAMACGAPLITSNVNGLEEIAGDAALLVNPDDIEEIADAIYKVLTDGETRHSLSKQGLERSKFFSWDKCAREILAVLEQLHEKREQRDLRRTL
jgi:glycosyltransferase involved in cell wall biosynthesis